MNITQKLVAFCFFSFVFLFSNTEAIAQKQPKKAKLTATEKLLVGNWTLNHVKMKLDADASEEVKAQYEAMNAQMAEIEKTFKDKMSFKFNKDRSYEAQNAMKGKVETTTGTWRIESNQLKITPKDEAERDVDFKVDATSMEFTPPTSTMKELSTTLIFARKK